jgi:hypothetical protein
MASVLSFGAPNILRMQGASPAVILLMILGLERAISAWPADRAGGVRRIAPALVLVFFGAIQMNDYFRVFPKDLRVRQEFTADIFYAPAHAADELAEKVDFVYVPEELMESLQVKFATIRHKNVVTYGPDRPLPMPPAGESAGWLLTERSVALAQQAGQDQVGELQAVNGIRRINGFTVPEADEAGQLINRTPWAELWVKN